MWHFCFKHLCDLDNLSCQGLVQNFESYELESPGVSGNSDSDIWHVSVKGKLRSRGLLLRLFRSSYVIIASRKYSLLLILSIRWAVSIEAYGIKRDFSWIWGMLICVQLNRSLIVRACVPSNVPCPKTIMFFPLIWKQAITMLIFFRTILKFLAFSWDFGTEYVIFSIHGFAFLAF